MKPPAVTSLNGINFLDYWYFVPLGLIAFVLFRRGKVAWESAKPMMFTLAAVILWVFWNIMTAGTIMLVMVWRAKVMGYEMIF